MTETKDVIVSMFVYGTLKRGQCRESQWPAEPNRVADSWIRGNLLGRFDYPALMPGENRVRGELWTYDAETIGRVIEALDRIEGTDHNATLDLYHRHLVDVFAGDGESQGRAYTYFYNRDPIAGQFTPMPIVGGNQSWPQES